MNKEKPLHFDGTMLNHEQAYTGRTQEPIVLTDEMRANISGNPFMTQGE